MAGVGASMGGHGELAREGKEGEGEGEGRGEGARLGAAWGEGGLQEGRQACSLATTAPRLLSVRCVLNVLSAVREKEAGRKREEKKRKGKKRGKKEKNAKFPNLKIFGETNKRQFMKLVKKLFLYKKGINLIIIK
jgi:hypothetical protein